MQSNEKEDEAHRGRHARSNGVHGGHKSSHGKPHLKEFVKKGRGLPRRLRHEMETRPEAVLATVAGFSFLAGVFLGSRLIRAMVVSAVPVALQHLFASELGPRLWSRVQNLVREVYGPQGP